jgi:hypothetical protein
MKIKFTLALVAVAALSSLFVVGPWRAKAATTLLVDDNNVQCPTATYSSIQAAVTAASPGDTIQVCAGNYIENVSINKALTVNGAQAGTPFAGRTFGGPNESTISGQVTIQAANVTFDGFSLTNPGQAFGIVVKTSGDDAVIKNNIINAIGSPTFAGGGGAQGIYLETGPDRVAILDNRISNIHSDRSSKGILIGDSASANPSLDIVIEGNTIEDITSASRGAYGIQANNGASTAPAATGFTTVVIRDNIIDDLTGGGWAHAIGLEGDTPNVLVEGNSISDVIDLTPSLPEDAIAVWFEANPSFSTAEVHNNNFENVSYGIAVHPSLSGGSVDGACNWWGAPNGPGPVGPGSGAKVSPNVIYSPWLLAPAPEGVCAGAVADNKDQCKNDGWKTLFRANGTSFKNQGDCIQYANTGK